MNLRGLAALVLASLSLTGCSASLTRAQARGALLTMADAVVLTDNLCSHVVDITTNKTVAADIGEKCARARIAAKSSLIAAAEILDAYGATVDQRYVCASQSAMRAVVAFTNVLASTGATMPPLITDAIALGSAVATFAGGQCEVSQNGK